MGVTAASGVTGYVMTTNGEVNRIVATDPYGAGVVYVTSGEKILLETGEFILLQADGYILLEG